MSFRGECPVGDPKKSCLRIWRSASPHKKGKWAAMSVRPLRARADLDATEVQLSGLAVGNPDHAGSFDSVRYRRHLSEQRQCIHCQGIRQASDVRHALFPPLISRVRYRSRRSVTCQTQVSSERATASVRASSEPGYFLCELCAAASRLAPFRNLCAKPGPWRGVSEI